MFGQPKIKGSTSNDSDRLSETMAALSRGAPVGEGLVLALHNLVRDSDASGAYYLLLDDADPNNLVTQACYAPEGNIPFPSRLNAATSFSGQALISGSPVAANTATEAHAIQREFGEAVKCALVVPITGHGVPNTGDQPVALLGCLAVVSFKRAGLFTPTVITRMEAYAAAMSLAICNDRLEQYRRRTIVEALERISTYLEAKDPRTAGHAERVAQLSLILGQKLGVDIETLMDLRVAATLMDIGTVAVPDAIAKKPAALTTEEFAVVATHPIVSYDICQTLALPERILMLVRNHHERLDGTGYPDKLRTSEIPLALRILSLADAFDAMQCARYHREGMTQQEALRQITQEAGVKFDPVVVQALRELCENGRAEPRALSEAA